MDALRKAEQQKQKLSAQGSIAGEAGTGAPVNSQSDLSLEPLSRHEGQPLPESAPPHAAADYHSILPELPTSLEALDEQFLAHAAQSKPARRPPVVAAQPLLCEPSPPPPTQPKVDVARDSARNVFEAKQQPRNNRNFAIAIGLISLVAAISIGAYFWWQLQPKGSMMVATKSPPPVTAPSITPAAPPAQLAQVAVPPAPTFSSPTAVSQQNDEEEDIPVPPKREIKPPPTAPAAPQPESPVRKTTTAEKTDPLLIQAHGAYNRGESELARQAWQKVLAKDSRNLDALRGLAVVAQQHQQWGEAVNYYQRALEVDPKDAIALTGLMALKMPTDMIQAESRLKTLLAEQPDSAYLNFALGNQFARQQRWAEAQQAYFKAYTTEPANAGYVFNLAVSLDQLHQARLAARYYNEALAVSERQPGQPAGFDRAEVLNRLSQLQAAVTP